ncbi:hypothetical protein [Hymenobacter sp. DG25A]|uniref:hypothetical protein n=1 Tax=Hymenobacter sp. DG25A TaxID=1385663 RepID=UPI0006BCDB5E|nr:hypothetical protein [Hymenobacter sp. DG25A]ALD21717.1 hypothetical protein AM218_11490 [Hymenobacter sp. DG25A]
MLRNTRAAICCAGILFTLFPKVIVAQNFKAWSPGYVVSTTGDTTRGLIHIPQFVTEEGVTLKVDEQGKRQQFNVQDLQAVGLQDGQRFVKRTITIGRNAATGNADSAAVLLQQLVSGYASFYRYNYNAARQSQQGTPSERVQYFIGFEGRSLMPVRKLTYQGAFPVLLQDCPVVVEALARTPFDERKIGNLILRYDTLCHTTPQAHDYRLPDPVSTMHLFVRMRGGLQQGKLFYPDFNYLPRAEAQTAVLPAYALEVRLANHGP